MSDKESSLKRNYYRSENKITLSRFGNAAEDYRWFLDDSRASQIATSGEFIHRK